MALLRHVRFRHERLEACLDDADVFWETADGRREDDPALLTGALVLLRFANPFP